MQKKYDVVALGELLIDFTEKGISDQGNVLLEANSGGALKVMPEQDEIEAVL